MQADEDLQDIVTRNLELAVRRTVNIAMHLCAAHAVVPATAAGLTAFGRHMLRMLEKADPG